MMPPYRNHAGRCCSPWKLKPCSRKPQIPYRMAKDLHARPTPAERPSRTPRWMPNHFRTCLSRKQGKGPCQNPLLHVMHSLPLITDAETLPWAFGPVNSYFHPAPFPLSAE